MLPLLTLEALRVRYGPLEALHGVSLTIGHGEVVALVGRNGAGKSTLLRAVAGYLRPASGRVLWQGADVSRASIGRRAGAGVLLIPDGGGVFRSLTVRENLELFAGSGGGPPGARGGRGGRGWQGARGSQSARDARSGHDAQDALGGQGVPDVHGGHGSRGAVDLEPAFETFPALKELARRRAGLLSGGEQQMLAVSRALLAPWRLLLVDELSQGLASALADRLYAVLAELAAAHSDRSVVFAEPYPRVAFGAVGQVHVLRRGELAASGSPAEFDVATL